MRNPNGPFDPLVQSFEELHNPQGKWERTETLPSANVGVAVRDTYPLDCAGWTSYRPCANRITDLYPPLSEEESKINPLESERIFARGIKAIPNVGTN